MNELFVGLWKQAESLHLPPYGKASTSPPAPGATVNICLFQGALEWWWWGVMGGAPGGLKRQLDNADVSVLPSNPPPPPPPPPSFSFRFLFFGVRKPSRSDVFVRLAAVSRRRVALGTWLCLTPI